MSNPTVAALGRVALFAGLSSTDLATIAEAAEQRAVPAGQVLIKQGTEGDEFFLIVDGGSGLVLFIGRVVEPKAP